MAEVINPYIAGNPVTGKEMFFGREDIFSFVRHTLVGQHRDQAIVLYGQRRTGKTSILYQMHRHLDSRYLCIFVDLHGLYMENEATFLAELAGQIRRVLRRDHGIETPEPDRAMFDVEPRQYFTNEFLDSVWEAVGNRHILLMIDEAVRLQEQVSAGKLDKSIFEFLRHLIQHYERLNFLFSIGSGLEQMEKEYAFLFNVALYKKISFLERAAAVDLITTPVQDYYRVEPAAVNRILEVTACHPYFTQLLCHSLFSHWQQNGDASIKADDVDGVLDEVVERGLAVLKHTWEESTPGEKAVLAGLTTAMGERNRPVDRAAAVAAWQHLGVSLPADEVARAMKSLAARDILSGDEQVKFNVDLFPIWMRKFQRLEWVAEEIRADILRWPTEAPPTAPVVRESPGASTTGRVSKPAIFIIGAGLLLVAGLILAGILLDWGPFRGGGEEANSAGSGIVVPGGDTLLVNDLAAAGGAVWAATDGGVVRWASDGTSALIPGGEIGFPDIDSQAIAVAPDGSLWIGGGGVSHIEPAGERVQFLDYFDRDSDLGMSVVRALLAEETGVWAGGATSRESSLSRFDGQSWDYEALPLDKLRREGLDLNVWSLMRDFDGNLWIGLVTDGILRWDGTEWSHWGPDAGVGGPAEGESRVWDIVQTDEGHIRAAAGDRGLLLYDPSIDGWEPIESATRSSPVTALAGSGEGTLWLGYGDGAVQRSTDGGENWAVVGSAEDARGLEITKLVEDDQGRLWAATYGGGVSVYQNGEWTHLQQ